MDSKAPDTIDRPQPLDRLEALGRGASRRKPEGGPKELTPRHKLLITYMIDGCGHESICKRILIERQTTVEGLSATVKRHPLPHEPLSLLEAADVLRIRRRNARELMSLRIFQQAYNLELQRYRDGERAASLRLLVNVRDDEGHGKAADRKVRMQAAQALLGEGDSGSRVTVNVSTGAQITAGIVIDMRDDDDLQPPTIEHERPKP